MTFMESYTVQIQNLDTKEWEDIELDSANKVTYEEALGFIKKVRGRGGNTEYYRVKKNG